MLCISPRTIGDVQINDTLLIIHNYIYIFPIVSSRSARCSAQLLGVSLEELERRLGWLRPVEVALEPAEAFWKAEEHMRLSGQQVGQLANLLQHEAGAKCRHASLSVVGLFGGLALGCRSAEVAVAQSSRKRARGLEPLPAPAPWQP